MNLEKTSQYVNHYSFHIMDPTWGHVTIKMSGHPPFGAQVILNGHEYVAAAATRAGVGYRKEGNCFSDIPEPARLAQIADTVSEPQTAGRLREVCDRWIYTACLCFGLDVADQRVERLCLRLLDLPGRVLTQPAVRERCPHATRLRRHRGPHPVPSRRQDAQDHVRGQGPAASRPSGRSPSTRSCDRDTYL